MGGNAKSAPAVAGFHWSWMTPLAMYTNPSLGVDFTPLAESAGVIASSQGNAIVAPIDLKKVRLGKARLVINMDPLSAPNWREGSRPNSPRWSSVAPPASG